MKKIEGFTDRNAVELNMSGYNVTLIAASHPHSKRSTKVPALLLISDTGEVPTVYTKEEVKAMVVEMLKSGSHNEDGWLVVRKQEIIGVLDRNGITL